MKYRFLFLLPVATLIIFLTVYASRKDNRSTDSYQTALRMIGHKLLLSAGDSRSRVLPVKELKPGKYQITFEKPLSLEPDSIFNIISNTTKSSSLPDEYTADVLNCSSHEVVYSFAMSKIDSNSMVPCLGRTLPTGCYLLNISFASAQPSGLKWIYAGLLGAGILSLVAYLFYLKQKKAKPGNAKVEDATKKNMIQIGKFSFYVDRRYLQINEETIELTDKESKLLFILASAPNSTIDREKFQKEVWENEGVIVTRSLDVFISRLRKKLEKDNSIRLTNVHNKGYKLELIT